MSKYKGYRNFETYKVMDTFFDEVIVDEKVNGDECLEMMQERLDVGELTENKEEEFKAFAVEYFLDKVDWDEIADQVNEHSGIENECEMCGAPIDYNQTTCSFRCFQASMR